MKVKEFRPGSAGQSNNSIKADYAAYGAAAHSPTQKPTKAGHDPLLKSVSGRRLPEWMKNPFVIGGAGLIVAAAIAVGVLAATGVFAPAATVIALPAAIPAATPAPVPTPAPTPVPTPDAALLATLASETQLEATPTSAPEPTPEKKSGGSVMSDMKTAYEKVHANYGDCIGWIKIDDCMTNAVFWTTDYQHYINYDRKGEKKVSAEVCLDYYIDDPYDYGTYPNWIMYGHNMRDWSKFGGIYHYRNDRGYWEDHKTVRLLTKNGYSEFTVAAAFLANVDTLSLMSTAGAGEMNSLIGRSEFDTGVSVSPGQRTLTLYTCDRDYSNDDYRFIVIAVQKPDSVVSYNDIP